MKRDFSISFIQRKNGIILCKESDMETVRFALNRSMSPMMIMQYKEQLKVGSVIQRSIEEYCKYINSGLI